MSEKNIFGSGGQGRVGAGEGKAIRTGFVDELPVCNEAERGYTRLVRAVSGESDRQVICIKRYDDEYVWQDMMVYDRGEKNTYVDPSFDGTSNLYLGGQTDAGEDGLRLIHFGDNHYIDAKGGGSLFFRVDDSVAGTERMRIESDGDLFFGGLAWSLGLVRTLPAATSSIGAFTTKDTWLDHLSNTITLPVGTWYTSVVSAASYTEDAGSPGSISVCGVWNRILVNATGGNTSADSWITNHGQRGTIQNGWAANVDSDGSTATTVKVQFQIPSAYGGTHYALSCMYLAVFTRLDNS